MTIVVGIRFKDSGKIYYFDPRDLELHQGDAVIVETVRGLEMAKVAHERRDVPESELVGELKPVVRHAEASDFERMQLLHSRHEEVMARCAEKVREHSLPMNLVKAEYSFDGSRLTFYFTAEKRVDFRLLVRDLARTFKSRIELRQIGPRDEAKLLGGIGPCGRLLCCATFLPDYARVSIKMAKDQDLPLNPAKISGVCGRLLCCLSYEHEQYVEMRGQLPRKGAWVQTPDGPGEVVSVNVIKQQVTVQLASSGMHELYNREQIQEATAQVSEVARSRVEDGVAPVSRNKHNQAGRNDKGNRRLLRDELDSGDILDALALLEDGDDIDIAAYTLDVDPPTLPRSALRQPNPPHRNAGSDRSAATPERGRSGGNSGNGGNNSSDGNGGTAPERGRNGGQSGSNPTTEGRARRVRRPERTQPSQRAESQMPAPEKRLEPSKNPGETQSDAERSRSRNRRRKRRERSNEGEAEE